MTARSPVLDRSVRRLARPFRRQLHAAGTVCVQSGAMNWQRGMIYGHSDFGPADVDKDRNEDYVLLWAPRPGAGRQSPDWAVALADGVTSSYRSDLGAELVCWSGLASVARSAGRQTPEQTAQRGIRSAESALRAAGRLFDRHTDDWQPADEFRTAWRYRLKCGVFLQTTLTLAWSCAGQVHLMRIGDGGAAWMRSDTASVVPEILLGIDTELHRVHALGPKATAYGEPVDLWQAEFPAGTTLALYTDGIAREVQSDARRLFQLAGNSARQGEPCAAAATVIECLMAGGGEHLQDNLSVVLVNAAQHKP